MVLSVYLSVCLFVCRLYRIAGALTRSGSQQRCSKCFLPMKKTPREIYGCGGGLLVAFING